MLSINSKLLAILDSVADLERAVKKCSMTAVTNASQLGNEAKKYLKLAVDGGYLEFLAGPKAYGFTAKGKPIGYNEVEVNVILDDGHIRANVQSAAEQRPEQPAKKTVSFTGGKQHASSAAEEEREKRIADLITTLGWGERGANRSETWVHFVGTKGKIQLYPVRGGKWTMYLSKNRGFDIDLNTLNEMIMGKGDIKSSYVSLKDATNAVDLNALKELLG